MARNADLTLSGVTDEVRTALGFSSIEVELEARDIEKCLRDALRRFNRVRPWRHRKALTISPTTKKYRLEKAAHPGLLGVSQVDFVTDTHRDDTLDPFDYEEQALAGLTAIGGESFGEIQWRRSYIEDATRIVSAEPEWFAQWEEDGEYYIYIDIRRSPVRCSFTWTSAYTPDDDPGTGMQWIEQGDVQWVLDFTCARAKQILGRVLGKHQGIITSDGGTDPTDHAELRQEGREDEEKLMEELKQRRRPLPPVIG